MASERVVPESDPNERDPLADQLAGLRRKTTGVGLLKVDALFGHRPAVLESIRAAKERGVSDRAIATALSLEGEPIGESAVATWLRAQRRRPA